MKKIFLILAALFALSSLAFAKPYGEKNIIILGTNATTVKLY